MRACLVPLVALLAACRIVPLAEPKPVAGAPRADLTLIAIHRALALEGFLSDEESPGRVRAHLRRRDWSMSVEIDYAREVEIRYVASENLGYRERDGAKYIHRAYNVCAQRLADAIARQSQLVLAEFDPDAYLGQEPVGAPEPRPSEPAP
jgi:hypothetical protein